MSTSVGFIGLFGVAVLNGVVMVSYFNELRREGMNLRLAVIKGSVMRLRPVLITAGVAAFRDLVRVAKFKNRSLLS